MRNRDLFNFRLLDLPLLRAWRHTIESSRCTNLERVTCCFSILQRIAVSTARISSTLMCSFESRHFHPVMVFQAHKPEGMLALRRWYLTWSSEEDCNRRSSPLKLTMVSNLLTNRSSFPEPWIFRWGFINGRRRKVWKSVVHPGEVRSKICCMDSGGLSPNKVPSWLKIQVTTVTFHELPKRVNLQSVWASLPCCCFAKHIMV